MNTENITILPNKNYPNIKTMKSDDIRCVDYIQYGYIKVRDLEKWNNGETIAVKMGQLSPSEKCYRGLKVIDCAVKRIDEQDTTALFDDEDELIPIYVFISKETDKEWRDYLISKGYTPSRTNKSREGIRIDRRNLFAFYGLHYKEETNELRSIREEKERKAEEERKRKERIENEYKKHYYEKNGTTYESDKEKLKEMLEYGEQIVEFRDEHKMCLKRGLVVDDFEWNESCTQAFFAFLGGVVLSFVFWIGLFSWDLLLNGFFVAIIAITCTAFTAFCAYGFISEGKTIRTEYRYILPNGTYYYPSKGGVIMKM